jgi:chitinase
MRRVHRTGLARVSAGTAIALPLAMQPSCARRRVHAVVAVLAGLLGGAAAASGCGSPSSGVKGGGDAASLATDSAAREEAGGVSDAARDAPHDGGVDGPSPDGAGDGATSAGDTGTDGSGSDVGTPPPAKVVGGYYPNFTSSPVRLIDVDPHYNFIYLFAATPVGGTPGTGAVEWTAPGDGMGAATNLVADIAAVRALGRKVIMSIGGAGQDMSFPDRATSQTFVTSIAALYTQLGGFDGIDWDTYEGTDMPDTSEMIWMSLQLKMMYPGFLITSPPAPWSTVDQTMASQMVAAGALDYAGPQYYDGPNLATQAYVVPNVDTWSTLLGEGHVVVGFGVWDQPNYMTIAQAVSTWDAVLANHPSIGGAFDWQIDVDQSTGWPFAMQVGPLVNP